MTAAITFIIPAHNASRTIGDTLRSLLAQTRGDWAAIVIDDGSTDGTTEVARGQRDRRISCVPHDHAGVAASRNRGLALARSDFVAFLDADDTVDPDFIASMLASIGDHEVQPAAYRYTGPDLEDVGWVITPSADDPGHLTEFNQYAIGAMLFRRASLQSIAGEEPFFGHCRHEDWELLLRLRGARWAPPMARPLYSYRLSPGSRTTALAEIWRDGLNLIARHQPDVTARSAALRRWTLRNLARAATASDAPLCRRLFEHLDALDAADVDTLAGALRWSIRRATAARESAALQPRDRWYAQILTHLGGGQLARECLDRVAMPDWSRIAAALAARLGPGQTLVIYGGGRNGQELIRHLIDRHVPLALIDDSPAAAPLQVPRLTIADLSPRHVVLVTPDDRAAILARLGKAPDAQILLPEQLVA